MKCWEMKHMRSILKEQYERSNKRRDKFQCLYLFLNMEYSKSILQKSRDEKVEDIKDKLENKKYHMEEDLTYSYYWLYNSNVMTYPV